MGERAVILRPSSNVSLDNNLTVYPSTLAAWQAISEEVADDGSSYITLEKNGAAFAEFGMSCSINPADIFNVKICTRVYAQQEVSGAEREDLYVTLSCVDKNGNVSTALNKTLLFSKDMTSNYENHSLLLDSNGLSIINDLNGLSSLRVKLERGSLGVTRITQLYLQIDYRVNEGGATTSAMPFYLPINGTLKKVESVTIPEGVVTEIKNSNGVILWSKGSKSVVLKVAKMVSDTYAGETSYTGEEFVLLNIYPKSGGTVNVTYGGLTKIITDDGTTETPNVQQVFFGTFNGISDEVVTPASGTLTIEGDYSNFAIGSYNSSKSATAYCGCVNEIVSFGNITEIYTGAFNNCINLTLDILPDNITSIGYNAFNGCIGITISSLPSGLISIGDSAFYGCTGISEITIPSSVTSIGYRAFAMKSLYSSDIASSSCCIQDTVIFLGTTPPTIGSQIFGVGDESTPNITVPAGCKEIYAAIENWLVAYTNCTVEAS